MNHHTLTTTTLTRSWAGSIKGASTPLAPATAANQAIRRLGLSGDVASIPPVPYPGLCRAAVNAVSVYQQVRLGDLGPQHGMEVNK